MEIGTLFSSVLSWVVQFLLFLPSQILVLIGNFLPNCDDLGVVMFTADVLNTVAQMIRFAWPILQFLPWETLWGLVSATILYFAFWWFVDNMPLIVNFVSRWWMVIVALFLILPLLNFFLSDDWMDSSVFTEVFGESPTSTGVSGGGFGGGGGGSW